MLRSFALFSLAAAFASLPACKGDRGSTGRSDAAPAASLLASAAGTSDATAPISDARLASAITEAITRDPILRSQPVHVSVANGEVTLTGTVRALADKWRTARLVADFKGAASLTDGLLVKTAARPDAEIAREVNDALKSDPATRTGSVRATASVGTVTLQGTADSYAQREQMADIASRARGVQQLSLAIAISGVSPRKDPEIVADVTEEMRDDARLDGSQVAVAVHAKDSVLSGVVGSLAQRDAAVADAWNAGVANVDAHAVRVDWDENERRRAATLRPPPSDGELADAIGRLLSNDVRVGAQLPAVQVNQGVITLSGSVLDFRAERAADRDARRVSGVWRVEDGMKVTPAKQENDAAIQQQVLRGIYDDVAAPDSRNVQAMTTNARVTLQGAVASQEERKMIEDDVEEVPGVVALDDQLKVVGYEPQTLVIAPESLRHRVVEGIFWDPRVPNTGVLVNVASDGDVILGGQVDSWEEAGAADADAIRAGAPHVINHLRVAAAP